MGVAVRVLCIKYTSRDDGQYLGLSFGTVIRTGSHKVACQGPDCGPEDYAKQ